jgi:hypothetical protein
MQKVVGSSPIIRSSRPRWKRRGFSFQALWRRTVRWARGNEMATLIAERAALGLRILPVVAQRHSLMTSQGTAHGRFQRAIHRRHLQAAEMAARVMGGLSLSDALSLYELLANVDPARYERAALRWVAAVH